MVSETTAFHGFDLIFILSLTLLSNRQDSPRQLYASDKQIQISRKFSSSTQVSFVSLSMEFGVTFDGVWFLNSKSKERKSLFCVFKLSLFTDGSWLCSSSSPSLICLRKSSPVFEVVTKTEKRHALVKQSWCIGEAGQAI
ncbi:hypothetical protein DY000_02048987 [Brassica cretica]|uniref:Uncharacterized protein n=1 Tax=Brassica cretica TaxID=69181 RepID=A0ABQ7ERK2_BRACR|nr:hypothetical protein DY000_02048987 [Brassica cretica]